MQGRIESGPHIPMTVRVFFPILWPSCHILPSENYKATTKYNKYSWILCKEGITTIRSNTKTKLTLQRYINAIHFQSCLIFSKQKLFARASTGHQLGIHVLQRSPSDSPPWQLRWQTCRATFAGGLRRASAMRRSVALRRPPMYSNNFQYVSYVLRQMEGPSLGVLSCHLQDLSNWKRPK